MYDFDNMKVDDSFIVTGKTRGAINAAVQYYRKKHPEKRFSIQQMLDGAFMVIRRPDMGPDGPVMFAYVQTRRDGQNLFGPTDPQTAFGVLAACEKLAGEPCKMQMSGNRLNDGLFNDIDLGGIGG